MAAANVKLRTQVSTLRTRMSELTASEDSVSDAAVAEEKRLRALEARHEAAVAAAAAARAAMLEARRALANSTRELAEDAERAEELARSGAEATLARDKARAERLRLREEADALRRRLTAAVRQTRDLNATVRPGCRSCPRAEQRPGSRRALGATLRTPTRPRLLPPPPLLQLAEAKARRAETRRVRSALEGSIFTSLEGLRSANATLRETLRRELPAARAALRSVRAETAAARAGARRAAAALHSHAHRYRSLLARLGRAPDLSIGPADVDEETLRALVAAGEAARLAEEGAFQPADQLRELLEARLLGVPAPAAAAAASGVGAGAGGTQLV